MPIDQALFDRVRLALARAPGVEQKKMFGGVTFMVRGKMCVSVGSNRIMCRIDPAKHDAALERDGSRTVMMKGRQYRGFVHVDADALRTKRQLDYWIKLALDYNATASQPAKKAKEAKNARR
jgi:TfoX/Sxy family transcriptional regulator of competence genes